MINKIKKFAEDKLWKAILIGIIVAILFTATIGATIYVLAYVLPPAISIAIIVIGFGVFIGYQLRH